MLSGMTFVGLGSANLSGIALFYALGEGLATRCKSLLQVLLLGRFSISATYSKDYFVCFMALF